jgi:hypothetical protein
MTSLCRFAWAGNAADAYRAAFGKLPADDKSLDILENWSRPVDDASKAMADQCQPALDQLHAGSVPSMPAPTVRKLIADLDALPPEKMDAGLAIDEKSAAKGSSAAKKILPSAAKLLNTVHKHPVWQAAFMAGLHVGIDGQAKLKQAFEYKKTSGGFQITSTAKFDGAAVVVEFGSDAIK